MSDAACLTARLLDGRAVGTGRLLPTATSGAWVLAETGAGLGGAILERLSKMRATGGCVKWSSHRRRTHRLFAGRFIEDAGLRKPHPASNSARAELVRSVRLVAAVLPKARSRPDLSRASARSSSGCRSVRDDLRPASAEERLLATGNREALLVLRHVRRSSSSCPAVPAGPDRRESPCGWTAPEPSPSQQAVEAAVPPCAPPARARRRPPVARD